MERTTTDIHLTALLGGKQPHPHDPFDAAAQDRQQHVYAVLLRARPLNIETARALPEFFGYPAEILNVTLDALIERGLISEGPTGRLNVHAAGHDDPQLWRRCLQSDDGYAA